MKQITAFGTIMKKEELASFESVMRFNELVLENRKPFPGYYDLFHVPVSKKEIVPKFLFLIIRSFDFFNDDAFVRITRKIGESVDFRFDARLGQLFLYNELTSCIRLRIENYTFVPELIRNYSTEGIHFAKHKTVKPFNSIIKIKKFFTFNELVEGIHAHPEKKSVHYIEIPELFDWEAFEHVTLFIKRNSDYKNFDAALGSLYTKDKMIDFVRIYDKSCTLDNLKFLREKYQLEIQRLNH